LLGTIIILNFAQNIDMQKIIVDNMDKIKALCMLYNVKSLFAFGSVCTEKFNDQSDIDLFTARYKYLSNMAYQLPLQRSLSNAYVELEGVLITPSIVWSTANSF